MNNQQAVIRVENLCKGFDKGKCPVLDNISFSILPGETMAVIGPSGCGKTTLLYVLSGLLDPSSGIIKFHGRDKGRPGSDSAFILQDFGLFPWKTVEKNVSLGLEVKGTPAKLRKSITASLLKELGLDTMALRYPVEISGGQKQRVAIARALATEPDILLMDEPFSSLDAITREKLQNTILDTWQRRNLTYILVTHSVEEAVFLGKRIMVLSDRPAHISKIIANPGFGDYAYRTSHACFDKVREVRKSIQINISDVES